jgi:histidine triad (HIT) family protein
MENCIFCSIIAGKIPANTIYEDDEILAFNDIHPVAPVHFLIIPKIHLPSLAEADESHQALLGKMMVMAPKIALEQGCTDGFRSIVNTGRVGRQEVYHLHVHIIGGSETLPTMLRRN